MLNVNKRTTKIHQEMR